MINRTHHTPSQAFWSLLAILADGKQHHAQSMAQALKLRPRELQLLWQQAPSHLLGLLRHKNDVWHLIRPLAILSSEQVTDIANQYGFEGSLHPVITSTNTYLLELAKQKQEPMHKKLILAYEQTAGRGRQGKPWENKTGECFMMSYAWQFSMNQSQLGGLALVTALAVTQALLDSGISAQIKWPNDLVLGADKLGGILIETIPQSSETLTITGIGINFITPKHVPQASAIQAAAPQAQIKTFYTQLLRYLSEMLPLFEQSGLSPFLERYQAQHRDHNRDVYLIQNHQTIATGTVHGIDLNGALQLNTADGIRTFSSGEISLRSGFPPSTESNNLSKKRNYLLLDAGNSQLKWAWVQQGRVMHQGKADYHSLTTLESEWLERKENDIGIFGCAVCSDVQKRMVAQVLTDPITWLSSMKSALGILNHYQDIQEHGADRWFNILGARLYSQEACVVVSCGTAVTIDALSNDNHYLGGTIMPGLYLMKESLAQNTANLNRQLGNIYPFPTTTENALASGLMDAVCGAILLMRDRLKNKISYNNKIDIIITGGNGDKIAQFLISTLSLDNRVEIVDNLVINGLLNWVGHK